MEAPRLEPLNYANDERKPWFIMHAGGWVIVIGVVACAAWQVLRRFW